MRGFTQRGFEHPAHNVTKRGWCKKFVKAIMQDDLAFHLGEGVGMQELLTYLLPHSYTIPSHQMVQRDLDLLHTQLDNKVNAMISVSACRCLKIK